MQPTAGSCTPAPGPMPPWNWPAWAGRALWPTCWPDRSAVHHFGPLDEGIDHAGCDVVEHRTGERVQRVMGQGVGQCQLHLAGVADDSVNTFEKEIYLDHLYSMTREELSNLPECIEKSILIDKEINQMRGNEIAEKYDMNLNTVKTKIRKARKMLKEAVITRNPEAADRLKEYF